MITTNIRLTEEDYQKYRMIALKKRISFAELVRQALQDTEDEKLSNKEMLERRNKAIDRILRVKGIKAHMSIREMIEEGRRY